MDEDRNKKLEEIEKTLKDIHKILKQTRWQMFVQGLWRAFGYLVGLILAIVIIGWLFNIIGLIPFLSNFSHEMKDVLNIARTR